jgi:hypothetical protein
MAMLVELVEHAGEEVSREHLRKTIWPADTFVDFDTSIGSCIRKIRRALGDTSENPSFIRTVHRKGFQFIAPVHIVLPDAPGTSSAERPFVVQARWYAANAGFGHTAGTASENGCEIADVFPRGHPPDALEEKHGTLEEKHDTPVPAQAPVVSPRHPMPHHAGPLHGFAR